MRFIIGLFTLHAISFTFKSLNIRKISLLGGFSHLVNYVRIKRNIKMINDDIILLKK